MIQRIFVATLTFVLALSLSAPSSAQNPGQLINQSITGSRVANIVGSGASDSIANRLVKLSLAVEKTKGRFEKMLYQSDNYLLQRFDDASVLIWDFSRSAQVAEFKLDSASIPIHYDSRTALLLVLRNGSLFFAAQIGNGKVLEKSIISESVSSASVSGDRQAILVGLNNGTVSKFTSKGVLVWQQKTFDLPVRELVSDHEGRRLAALSSGQEAKILDADGKTVASWPAVKKIGNFNTKGDLSVLFQNAQLVKINRNNTLTHHTPPAGVRAFSLSPNGNSLLVLSEQGELNLGADKQWRLIDNQVKDVAFVSDKRFIAAKDNGIIHLREAGLDHYLLAIIPGASGWVVVDHEGRYDGTIEGNKDVKWSGDGKKLNLDQFFQAYFQPGLLAAYVANVENKALQGVPASTGEGVFPPATLDLQFPDGRMKSGQPTKVVAIAESTGGELPEDIRLFHNGKRLPDKAKIGSQRVNKDGKILLVQVFAFIPESGINEVFGEVRNAHGVGSRSEIQREVTDGYRSPGRLVVIGTGIDKYRNKDMNLDFAAADVKAIVQKLDDRSNAIHTESVQRLTMDSRATKHEILAQLSQLEQLKAEDSVILFFAGHGYTDKGEWYFLPHDVDRKQIAATSISAKQIQDALVNAPPKRIFLMVDACHAGASIDSFNKFRAFQRRFVQQMGRNSGITVLTATRADQLAAELPEFGHGVFTHVILDGLSGRAAAANSGGKVSAHQLANYVGANLERLAQPYLAKEGLAQTPAHFVIGSDFLITDTAVGRP